jgi:inositol-phosphate phosphatase / L-galactose 1-phosphate phosphatase / histidinol-phosphatase
MTVAKSFNAYVEFAEQLADKSGQILRQYYRCVDGIETKADRSLVTRADREVEKALRAWIKKQFPEHGIIGEEFGSEREEAKYQWVLDPIDGTTSFLIGRPIFGTLIALVYNGKPLLGIIDQPITKERWVGVRGEFASFNKKMITSKRATDIASAILCTTSTDLLSKPIQSKFQALTKQVQCTVYGGDCYNYGLLAAGHVDIVIEMGLKVHDFCALVAVIEAAGGVITDFNGKALTLSSDGNVIAASSKKIHRLVMEQMFGSGKK